MFVYGEGFPETEYHFWKNRSRLQKLHVGMNCRVITDNKNARLHKRWKCYAWINFIFFIVQTTVEYVTKSAQNLRDQNWNPNKGLENNVHYHVNISMWIVHVA
jgi:hypothetical protein